MEKFEENKPESIEEKEGALLSVKEELEGVQEEISKAREKVLSIQDEAKSVVGDTEKELELLQKMKDEGEAIERFNRLNTSLKIEVDDLLKDLTKERN